MSSPLANVPDAALSLILGFCSGRPQSLANVGQVSTLCAEMRRRGLWETALAAIDPDLAARLRTLEEMDRGAVYAQTGRRPAPVPEITDR
ncbi:hypothetical protein SEA_ORANGEOSWALD_66 [Mycobacterium phage OrangeOswald]|uniref:DUF7423 domain-containing protein n=2 Tax=Pipefishvirus athena TaxID=1982916 RepID=X2KYN9_9CAUD|nr:hypothetical protein CM10_gp066 [Mycobacterium phage Akoma]AHN83974.1 hypothetical protein AUDREY_66 [Mycobacterium phage Audrey]AHN84282.1 hypothetical protein HEATHCLIFF_66 [Mycobacterium phage Heathcliff]AJD82655.1 hypothetical protein CHANDLER_66 [Mycobacterium phage Chandler]AKF14994.1 hypothetical protein SEA_ORANGEOSWALD_66 [Mycobacterium phage OrangeOswald]AUX82549.1 hypothetical protein SEA_RAGINGROOSTER_65 [Mycobacterium phage RagingRooster]AVJ49070.1 hypothetical protein PBI_BAL